MYNFKIEEKDDYFIVIPTAVYLSANFNRFELPYDTNWEIYKLFNFGPEDLFKYLTITFNASIFIYQEFPYISIRFKKEIDAIKFQNELEQRVINNTGKNS